MAGVQRNQGIAREQEDQCGGVAGLGHAGGDHATGHANLGIATILSTQGTRGKTNRVTLCQIEFPTTLLTKVFANSKLRATRTFEK